MSLYSINGKVPKINGKRYFIAQNAILIGNVEIENDVSIWFGVVIRADNDFIYIGASTNIQDGTVIHTDPGIEVHIGKNVTVGHKAMLHGCKIGDNSVIGMNATIMNGADIGKNCVIGSQTLILENQIIPDNSLVVGSPGRVKKTFTSDEINNFKWFSKHYVKKISIYNESLQEV